MPDIEKLMGVDAGDIETVMGVEGGDIEAVMGVDLVTFSETDYTITSSETWSVPAGANHYLIKVTGGGSAGHVSSNDYAAYGGAGAGAATNAKAAIGNVTALVITLGGSNASGGYVGTQSTITGTGFSTMTANGGGIGTHANNWTAGAGGTGSGGNTNVAGGTGGTPQQVTSGNNYTALGGDGGDGACGGGGGGAKGQPGNGTSSGGSGNIGGNGGAGGRGTNVNVPGFGNGQSGGYGGGGGAAGVGKQADGSGNQAGTPGVGGAGVCYITAYPS